MIDLQITSGQVVARVSGSSIYRTTISVQPVPRAGWQQICADCAGSIDSLVELLQGRLSKPVMDRLCRQGDGLFPAPRDITLNCSCPDSATMCKHVAAVLYGVGALFGPDMEGASATEAPAPPTQTTPINPPAPSPTRAPDRPARAAEIAQPKVKPNTRPRSPAARLLAALRRQGWLDNATARAATGLDADAVRPLLKQLVADGHAQVEGQRRGTRYVAIQRRRTR